ncbi:MAG: hypothetical protein GXO80_02810 [Chlorobi bacterium]|nr:hypothetical protein [Chlorobiota bacterium]
MKKNIIFFFLLAAVLQVSAQKKEHNYSLDGYITNMQSVMFDSLKGNWTNDNLIHNRLNFNWFPNDDFSVNVGIRTRIFTGESLKYIPGYADFISGDKGFIDLNTNLISEKSVIINSQIDRAYLSFEKGNLSITAGRQRINWGRSFVWNPNDIFNSYSFFDFDYPEKPGSDALRIQYYTGATSSVDFVTSADSSLKISAAGMYRFNLASYDFQILGGMISERDYVIGGGWEGAIKNMSFRGEISYLHPKENFTDTSGLFILDVSSAYTFQNSLSLQFEFLYNQQPTTGGISSFEEYYYKPLSVKNLSFTEYNIFGSIAYPITPLLNLTLSGMYYPKISGYFIGPSFSYSLSNNADFSLVTQTFGGNLQNRLTGNSEFKSITFAFLRFKYNF